MNQRICAVLLGVMSIIESAFGEQGAIDRSSEIDRFVHAIETGTRIVLTQNAIEIVDADLSDATLASAIYEKLVADLPKLTNSAVDVDYRSAMFVAIASTGRAEYSPKLLDICKNPKRPKAPRNCEDEVAKMDWYKKRNQLAMPKRSEFQNSESRLIRIANLVEAADYSFKWEAVERMMKDPVMDPRLAEVVNAQVLAYMKGHSAYDARGFKTRILTQAWLVKLLGLSGDIKYRETADKLLQSDVPAAVKRQARELAVRLDT